MPIIQIPVTKAKGGFVEVDTDALPEEVFREWVLQGGKSVLNRGMSKITATTYPEEQERKAAAMAQAQANLEANMRGEIRITGGKAKKATGEIQREAVRLAKQAVKDAIKADGEKISHYETKDITTAAKALVDTDPQFLALAEEAVKARLAKPASTAAKGVLSLIKVSEKKVAAANAKKAKAKAPGVSAKQAGLVAKVRPGLRPNA